jgi:hypothetical protein
MKIKKTSILAIRKQTLINNGFTAFEANQLKTIPTQAPYLTRLIEDRQVQYMDYYTKVKNPTKKGWTIEVQNEYKTRGWKSARTQDARSAVWAMIHDYENRQTDNDKWWDSGRAKKAKTKHDHNDFNRKFDALFNSYSK